MSALCWSIDAKFTVGCVMYRVSLWKAFHSSLCLVKKPAGVCSGCTPTQTHKHKATHTQASRSTQQNSEHATVSSGSGGYYTFPHQSVSCQDFKRFIILFVNTQALSQALQLSRNPEMNSMSPPTPPTGKSNAKGKGARKVCQLPTQPIACGVSVEKNAMWDRKECPWGRDNPVQDMLSATEMPTICAAASIMYVIWQREITWIK